MREEGREEGEGEEEGREERVNTGIHQTFVIYLLYYILAGRSPKYI